MKRILLTVTVALLALSAAGVPGARPAQAVVTPCPAPVVAAGVATVTCVFTGDAQTWQVPAGVTSAEFDVRGAEGGGQFDHLGGMGGRAVAILDDLVPAETVNVYVGGAGQDGFQVEGPPAPPDPAAGGFNGGGAGGLFYDEALDVYPGGGGGGGASDVRRGGNSLADRVLVAGGGGGAGLIAGGHGGAGGGLTGGQGGGINNDGEGGNQDGTSGSGTQGTGSDGHEAAGGGGGGLWGGAGGPFNDGGGGGSGFGPAGVAFETGVRAGDGVVIITYDVPETGTLEVRKMVLAWNDPGRFDLLIDGEAHAEGVASGGSTGPVEVPVGEHTVSELGADGTDLGDYQSFVKCQQEGQFLGSIAFGFGTSLTVDVGLDQSVVCTIYNLPTVAEWLNRILAIFAR